MREPALIALVLFLAVAAAALGCADGRRPRLFAALKPLATLLLLPVAGLPAAPLGPAVAFAIVLSALGDAALNHKHRRAWFLGGMGCFMLAHGAYVTAFLFGGGARATIVAAAATVAAGAGVAGLLRRLWAGIHPALKIPCVAYGVVIVAMVGSASTLLGGPWPRSTGAAALGGAALFYCGDVALALALFGRPFRHAQVVSMGLYWSGQLGIALAARGQAGGCE